MSIKLKKEKSLYKSNFAKILDSIAADHKIDIDQSVIVCFIRPINNENLNILINSPELVDIKNGDKFAEELAKLCLNICKGNLENEIRHSMGALYELSNNEKTKGIIGKSLQMLKMLFDKYMGQRVIGPMEVFGRKNHG